ncbi:RNA polymerase sigma factor [Streptomyces althioticus]
MSLATTSSTAERTAPNASEPAWLTRARTGDPEAFAFLYREYRGTVYGYLLARTRDRHLAEDLTQEVFARALRNISGFA